MTARRVIAVIGAVLLAGCAVETRVTGTVSGEDVTFTHAVVLQEGGANQGVIVLAKTSAICRLVKDGEWGRTNTPVLVLTAVDNGTSPAALATKAGHYVIRSESGLGGTAGIVWRDSRCDRVIPEGEHLADTGTTILDSDFDPGQDVTGSVDLEFPNGHLSGTFDATLCDTGLTKTSCTP